MVLDFGGEVGAVAAAVQPEQRAADQSAQGHCLPIVRRWEAWIGWEKKSTPIVSRWEGSRRSDADRWLTRGWGHS